MTVRTASRQNAESLLFGTVSRPAGTLNKSSMTGHVVVERCKFGVSAGIVIAEAELTPCPPRWVNAKGGFDAAKNKIPHLTFCLLSPFAS